MHRVYVDWLRVPGDDGDDDHSSGHLEYYEPWIADGHRPSLLGMVLHRLFATPEAKKKCEEHVPGLDRLNPFLPHVPPLGVIHDSAVYQYDQSVCDGESGTFDGFSFKPVGHVREPLVLKSHQVEKPPADYHVIRDLFLTGIAPSLIHAIGKQLIM